ncbi:hypothetical protein ACFSQU_06575 [Massilia sp. GCM10020059]|uniref:Uncharacterized protein n=1 Tax=Massilia agrisoli TaxID=2892444 RepID=A0ABS8IXN3_9BURK|nr:hypothetical protein [Massilia agrisoli]MCC6073382.1 hypothetical protein [Massilia agrisoli]
MSAAYQHLAVAKARPGMILSDELLDSQGHLLLPRGAVLTEATIALLPRHGIESVAVQVAAAAQPAPDPDAVAQRLAHLFRKNDIDNQNDWATGILRRYVEDYRLQRGVEE